MSKTREIYSKGFRLTLGKTKFSVIIGWYKKHHLTCFQKHGLFASIIQDGFAKDHLETSGFRLWIKSFCILYSKYQHASKFGIIVENKK